MPTTHHMNASIEGLMKLTNRKLGILLEMDGKEARNILKGKIKKGEKVIPCGDCDGFDPVNGRPGNEENESNKQIQPSHKE
jgi:hypothetical protein